MKSKMKAGCLFFCMALIFTGCPNPTGGGNLSESIPDYTVKLVFDTWEAYLTVPMGSVIKGRQGCTRPGINDDTIWGRKNQDDSWNALVDEEDLEFEPIVISGKTIIADREDLENITNDSGSYVLVADIDLKEKEWTPFPRPFKGHLNGAGHTIKRFKFAQENGGLFQTLGENAVVENLNVQLAGNENRQLGKIGTIAVKAEGNSKVRNVAVSGSISGTANGNFIGGIVGAGNSSISISDCSFTGNISVIKNNKHLYLGGITGSFVGLSSAGDISGCSYSGNISITKDLSADTSGKANVGGIAGDFAAGTIQACYSSGDISVAAENTRETMAGGLTGGFTGDDAEIADSYFIGDVIVKGGQSVYVGGVVANNSGYYISKTRRCYAVGAIQGEASDVCYAGGITGRSTVGYISAVLESCFAAGTVSSKVVDKQGSSSQAGGIAGVANGTLSGCASAVTSISAIGSETSTATTVSRIAHTSGNTSNNRAYSGTVLKNNGTIVSLAGETTGGDTMHGETTASIEDLKNHVFSQWDTTNIWHWIPGTTEYPVLK
ncbi:hypothetical protein LJC14_06780 [Treponema sp. OttesenSCG-928-L16]|nr:hypothetical protein [Treponema sp. OttesenSCG-928-L16]